MGSLRERNRLLVVDALRRSGFASRSDLARLTGLSRTTVGSLVAELQAQGLVVEDDGGRRAAGRARPPAGAAPARPGRGCRRRHLLRPRRGPRRSRRSLLDRAGGEPARHRRRPLRGRLDRLAVELLHALQAEAGVDDSQIVGVGVALPGPIDRRSGKDRLRGDPARLGRRAGPARAVAAARACTSRWTTTRTSARSPRRRSARAAGSRTSSTSCSAPASAPAWCSTAASTAAPPGSRASSATCRCGPGRRRLPLRQPRLPGDGRRRARARRAAPPAPRAGR